MRLVPSSNTTCQSPSTSARSKILPRLPFKLKCPSIPRTSTRTPGLRLSLLMLPPPAPPPLCHRIGSSCRWPPLGPAAATGAAGSGLKFEGLNNFPEPSSKRTFHRPSALSQSTISPNFPFRSGIFFKPQTSTRAPGMRPTPSFASSPGRDSVPTAATLSFAAPSPGPSVEARALASETASSKFMLLNIFLERSSMITFHLPSASSQSTTEPNCPFKCGCALRPQTRTRRPADSSAAELEDDAAQRPEASSAALGWPAPSPPPLASGKVQCLKLFGLNSLQEPSSIRTNQRPSRASYSTRRPHNPFRSILDIRLHNWTRMPGAKC
mmetsp:Transcript_90625/g.228423  ORF Transcript_90625/g.228423 Transcript_90625/m.228423 type:complete len:325 (-) Transcript_90625:382-1356(-)